MFHLEPKDIPYEKMVDYFERHKMKWEKVDMTSIRYQEWDKCWFGSYVSAD